MAGKLKYLLFLLVVLAQCDMPEDNKSTSKKKSANQDVKEDNRDDLLDNKSTNLPQKSDLVDIALDPEIIKPDLDKSIRDSALMALKNSVMTEDSRQREERFINNASPKLLKALSGKKNIPIEIKEGLTILELSYFGMDGKVHHDGLLVLEKQDAQSVKKVFELLLKDRFPIQSIIPVNAFGWDDDSSMRANNTSCFNYRPATGSGRLSEHAYGLAIDINPRYNPFVKGDKIYPSNGEYSDTNPGTIFAGDPVIQYFADIGWKWGGNWKNAKDYQHFSKNGR